VVSCEFSWFYKPNDPHWAQSGAMMGDSGGV